MSPENIEKIRDVVKRKIESAERFTAVVRGQLDPENFSKKDLGIKASHTVYPADDKGITDADINKAIQKVGKSREFLTGQKERMVDAFIDKTLAMGQYGYLKLRKLLGNPKDNFTVQPRFTKFMNKAIRLINPGGTVWVEGGDYELNNPVLISQSYINLISLTLDAKFINKPDEETGTDLLKVDNSDHNTIYGLFLDGNKDGTNKQEENITSGYGIIIHGSENNFGRVLIERCRIYKTPESGIYVYGEENNNALQPFIIRNHIEQIGANDENKENYHGILIDAHASDAHVIDNDIGVVTGCGIQVNAGGTSLLISLNFAWQTLSGISCYQIKSGMITSNRLDINEEHGIYLNECKNIVVNGNLCKLNSRKTDKTYSGIVVYNSKYCSITGNRSGAHEDYEYEEKGEQQRYGILESGPYSDFNLISGNNCYENKDDYYDIVHVGNDTVVGINLGRYTPHKIDASLIDRGTFDLARIPDLPTSQITSGRFLLSRLPAGTSGYFLKGMGAGSNPVYSPVYHYWSDIQYKPSTFPPESHSAHPSITVSGQQVVGEQQSAIGVPMDINVTGADTDGLCRTKMNELIDVVEEIRDAMVAHGLLAAS